VEPEDPAPTDDETGTEPEPSDPAQPDSTPTDPDAGRRLTSHPTFEITTKTFAL